MSVQQRYPTDLLYEMFKNIMHNGRRHTFVWFHNVCVPDMCALWELLSSYICSSSISVKASLQITGASCRDHHSLTFWSHMLTFDGSFCLILGIFALVWLSGWKWTLHFTAVCVSTLTMRNVFMMICWGWRGQNDLLLETVWNHWRGSGMCLQPRWVMRWVHEVELPLTQITIL